MASDADRAKAYRVWQAEIRSRLKLAGLQEIKLVSADGQVQAIRRLAESAIELNTDRLEGMEDPEAWNELSKMEANALFEEAGTPQQARFRLEDEGEVALKMAPYRSLPVLITWPFPREGHVIDMARFRRQFPLLDRVFALGDQYSWDTPEYRSICAEVGIDPDFRRPTFPPEWEQTGEALIEWLAGKPSSHSGEPLEVSLLVHDVVATISDQQNPTRSRHALVDEMGRLQSAMKDMGVPEVDSLLEAISKGKMPYKKGDGYDWTMIRFLPSAFGTGFSASLYSFGVAEGDGWPQHDYASLGGLAIMPEKPNAWTKTVIDHLRKDNGVIFLNDKQAEAYMAGEGRYWAWAQGYPLPGTTKGERFIWTLHKPQTPLSDKAQKLHATAVALRLHASEGNGGMNV